MFFSYNVPMANNEEKITIKDQMHYQPVKDSILIGTSALLVGVILAFTFGFKPREDSLHVEIRYQNTLLFDPLDPNKNTSISFPESGERNIVFHKEDGHLFLGEGVDFDFLGESVTISLYAEGAIEIKTADITCPDHTCSKMGKISFTYTPIVCLPNQIQAMIVAESLPEWDA